MVTIDDAVNFLEVTDDIDTLAETLKESFLGLGMFHGKTREGNESLAIYLYWDLDQSMQDDWINPQRYKAGNSESAKSLHKLVVSAAYLLESSSLRTMDDKSIEGVLEFVSLSENSVFLEVIDSILSRRLLADMDKTNLHNKLIEVVGSFSDLPRPFTGYLEAELGYREYYSRAYSVLVDQDPVNIELYSALAIDMLYDHPDKEDRQIIVDALKFAPSRPHKISRHLYIIPALEMIENAARPEETDLFLELLGEAGYGFLLKRKECRVEKRGEPYQVPVAYKNIPKRARKYLIMKYQ